MKRKRGIQQWWFSLGKAGRRLTVVSAVCLLFYGVVAPAAALGILGAMILTFRIGRGLELRRGAWAALAGTGLAPVALGGMIVSDWGCAKALLTGLALWGLSRIQSTAPVRAARLAAAGVVGCVLALTGGQAPGGEVAGWTGALAGLGPTFVLFAVAFALYPTVRGWAELPPLLKAAIALAVSHLATSMVVSPGSPSLLPVAPAIALWLAFVYERFVRIGFDFGRRCPSSGLVLLQDWGDAA